MEIEEQPDGVAAGRLSPPSEATSRRELERLRAELAAVRDAHARDQETLRLLRDVIPVMVYTFDLRTMEAAAINGHIKDVLGYEPAELASMGRAAIATIVHPADQPALFERMPRWATAGVGEWLETEVRVRHRDGSWRWIATRDTVLERGPEGSAVKLVGALSDVTSRKDLEAALARSQTLEAVGRLAGGIAHDFNNLLTVMLGSVSLAQQATVQGNDPRPMLDQVATVAREASRLTRQLLTFASRELGGPEVIDVGEEVQVSLGILRRLVEDDVTVELVTPSEPVWVSLQRAQLTQVLLNLVVNARDAMPRGGKLELSVERAPRGEPGGDEAQPGVRVRVQDSGEGMSADTLRRIFDPFFTTKLPGKGTGLGLSTVYGIVRGRGGDVDVRSEEGRGTVFDLWFPLAVPPAPPSRRASVPIAAVAPGTTVLVVEDSGPLAETCVAILGSAGYRVLTAKDGVAALETIEKEGDRVAIVLSDVVMPRLSGIDLAARLAEIRPATRVVLWSGYPQGIGAQGANVFAVLPKPVEPEALLRTLARAAARRV